MTRSADPDPTDPGPVPAGGSGGPVARELLIEHSFAEGTTLSGTRRGDDLYRALRGLGWLYRRSVGDYRLASSVDKPAKTGPITDTTTELRHRGFIVTVTIDNEVRAMEDAEADRAAGAQDHAARLAARADRLAAAAEARDAAARTVLAHIPPGQPFLVDHCGYAADRRRRERAWSNQDTAAQLRRDAATAAAAADTASRHMDFRNTPITVANRIDRLEADLRRVERERTAAQPHAVPAAAGESQAQTPAQSRDLYAGRAQRLDAERAHLTEQLRYWTGVREQQVADGTATNYASASITRGDFVRYGNAWYPVVRVNAKSVTVPSIVGGSTWTDTLRYTKVRDHAARGDSRWEKIRDAIVRAAQQAPDPLRLHPAYRALLPTDPVN